MQTPRRLIVGCGYLGMCVAARWIKAGISVAATTRSPEKGSRLAAAAIEPIIGDPTSDGGIPLLSGFDSVLFAVGFDRSAGRSIHDVYVGGLRNVLRRLEANPPRRLIYISSTGVYGDAEGEWIDEETPCAPLREGGKACLAAERLLETPFWRERAIILRLAGIYGPGRLPRREDLVAGKPIASLEKGYLNLIHVEDAAAAVNLAIEKGQPPRTYLVSDGSPVLRGKYYREVARQIGAPPPSFDETTEASRIARGGANKRVSNTRIVKELGFCPRYPSYREGIMASLAAESA